MVALIDFTGEEYARNPYPTYHKLRNTAPILWDEATLSWYISRFRDVNRLLMDDALRARGVPPWVSSLPQDELAIIGPVEEFFSHWLVFSDESDHLTLRNALLKALAGSAMQRIRVALKEWTASAAATVATAHSPDLIDDFSRPLALRCMQEVLGVSEQETEQLLNLSSDLIKYLITPGSDLDAAVVANRAIAVLEQLVFEELLPRRTGLINRTLAKLNASESISKPSTVAAVAQFLTGTVEPTTTAIAVTISQVAANKPARSALADGSLSNDSVVEEGLRFDAPFHFAPRVAAQTFRLRGQTISAGQRVVLLLASANRDEDRWTSAERFNPFREPQRHLAFGRGGHSCLGAALARAQAAEALRACLAHDLFDTFSVPLDRLPSVGATTLRRFPLFGG